MLRSPRAVTSQMMLAAFVAAIPATGQPPTPFYSVAPEPATQEQLVEQVRATRLLAARLKASLSSQLVMAARTGDSSGVALLGEELAPAYLDSVFVALDKALAFSSGEGRLYSKHPDAVQEAALDEPPKVIDGPVPELPGVGPDMRRAATVVVRALVDSDGTVIGLGNAKGAEKHYGLAREAAWNWKFEPPVRNGTPTKAWVHILFN